MRDFIEDNRKHWEELAELHPETDYYDVEGFLDGDSTLDPIEPEELGSVENKSLLHLQCHFGLDTLSWARLGADVTGVDISIKAVETARQLADEAGLERRARFVQSDVYELVDDSPIEDEAFDIVYTSFGVLFWLPDLDAWADIVVQFVRDGGTFYLVDHHPLTNTLSEDSTADHLKINYPYFRERISYDATETGSYGVEPEDLEHGSTHGWAHSLGEIVSALCGAGLTLEFLHEYAWSTFKAVDAMEQREDGRYVLPGLDHDLPFVFSLRASR